MRHRHIIVNPIALKFHDGIRTRDVSAVRASEGAEPKPLFFCFANLLTNLKNGREKNIHFNTTTSLTLNLSTNVEAR